MSDLIKRDDAIKVVDSYIGTDPIVEKLKSIPSAEPTVDKDYLVSLIQEAVYDGEACKRLLDLVDRPQGEWIKHDEERDYCSVCKHIFKTRTLTKQDKWTTYVDDLGYNFCPNCGARMTYKDIDVPYKIASDQRDYDSTYEPTYNEQDGSM